ncbi:MAG TPA: rhamnogalacturonan lyase [Bacteroidales bacterium]
MNKLHLLISLLIFASSLRAQRQMEYLGRGVIALHENKDSVFISWRMLGTDPDDIAFNLYRKTGNHKPVKLNHEPIKKSTNYIDSKVNFSESNAYFVKPLVNNKEEEASAAFTLPANAPVRQYLSIPLKTLDGYTPNDISVGDLDGDGEYEIVLKQEMRGFDNSRKGVCPGTTKFEAYKLDGTFMWRIDLGPNIREGAHYTQFMVYDFDGDGKAEVAVKTAEGTIDGTGVKIGDTNGDGITNYVNPETGYILDGPEFLSIFDGKTGKELARTDYIPRGPKNEWKQTWRDDRGNRIDRFLAGVGYFDGVHPSLLICRGYYGRAVLQAWNWRDGKLSKLWTFDTDDGTPGNRGYRGQGAHSIRIGDIDDDGKDEIIYGAACIGHDGKGVYSTGLGHGDALHLGDLDPDRHGLEVFMSHESPSDIAGSEFRDARTGELIWGKPSHGDVGRGMTADIDPRYSGCESWVFGGEKGLYNTKGQKISDATPRSCNFGIWWDGDLLRELLDKNRISKWNWKNSTDSTIFVADGCMSNNGTKSTPGLCADILGDWREEVIFRTADNKELRIYSTTIPTDYRFYTLMHDPVYRLSVAIQNVAYNQPTQAGFFIGEGMNKPPKPPIYVVKPALLK